MSIYVGDSNDIARTAKKLYVGGNGGIARTVIRAYAGDENNIARMVFGSPLKRYIIQDGAMASGAYWVLQSTPSYSSSTTGRTANGTFGDGYYDMYFSNSGSCNLKIMDSDQNNLDFTEYQKICIDYYVGRVDTMLSLCLQTSGNAYINNSNYLLSDLNSTIRTTAVFDIASATGVKYFYLNMRNTKYSSSAQHAYIYNLWIE